MPPILLNLVFSLLLLAMSGREDLSSLLELDGVALTEELTTGHVTAEAVMLATLDRIDQVNDHFKAIVSIRDREDLLKEARLCDRERRRQQQQQSADDETNNKQKKRLLGIPMAIKDLSNVVGLPTTMGGSWLFRFWNYPKISDHFVQNIDKSRSYLGLIKSRL